MDSPGVDRSDAHASWPAPGNCPTLAASMANVLYCGDNLEVLRDGYIEQGSVDLIYLDPPFNSQRTYNLIYKDSRAQEVAFKDYWSWQEAASTYASAIKEARVPLKLRALLKTLHDLMVENNPDLLAYVVMMSVRLVELHHALKPSGSLYLHCDPTASHYLKLMLDCIFGYENFRNEITWQRSGAKNDPKRYGRSHDIAERKAALDEYQVEIAKMTDILYVIGVMRDREGDRTRHLLNGLTLYRRFIAEAKREPSGSMAKDFLRDVEFWEKTIGSNNFPRQNAGRSHQAKAGEKPN